MLLTADSFLQTLFSQLFIDSVCKSCAYCIVENDFSHIILAVCLFILLLSRSFWFNEIPFDHPRAISCAIVFSSNIWLFLCLEVFDPFFFKVSGLTLGLLVNFIFIFMQVDRCVVSSWCIQSSLKCYYNNVTIVKKSCHVQHKVSQFIRKGCPGSQDCLISLTVVLFPSDNLDVLIIYFFSGISLIISILHSSSLETHS